MFDQILIPSQVNRWEIIRYKLGIRFCSQVPERLKTEELRKFRNIRKVCKIHRTTAQWADAIPK